MFQEKDHFKIGIEKVLHFPRNIKLLPAKLEQNIHFIFNIEKSQNSTHFLTILREILKCYSKLCGHDRCKCKYFHFYTIIKKTLV